MFLTFACIHRVKYRKFTYFLVWKFCRKAQFLHSFELFARNYAKTGAVLQNFYTKKFNESTVFYAVIEPFRNLLFIIFWH